ncbi:MAG: hypothetical protein ACRDBX_03585 [Erysipelotrichaceae bacterium]
MSNKTVRFHATLLLCVITFLVALDCGVVLLATQAHSPQTLYQLFSNPFMQFSLVGRMGLVVAKYPTAMLVRWLSFVIHPLYLPLIGYGFYVWWTLIEANADALLKGLGTWVAYHVVLITGVALIASVAMRSVVIDELYIVALFTLGFSLLGSLWSLSKAWEGLLALKKK